jgi:serine protease inhibitor
MMTWAGAKGETADQMAKVLHLDGPADRNLEVAGEVIARYSAPGQPGTIRIANRLFGERSTTFQQPYLDQVKTAFGASLEPLNFEGDAAAARTHINRWVAKQTNDRITDLLPETAVDASTRLVLVDAIHFLGGWERPFEKDDIHPAPFFTAKDIKKDVPTMHQTETLGFAARDGVKILELPYKKSHLAMDFVLPDAVGGLALVEARLTSEVFTGWINDMSSQRVIVSLPKAEMHPPSLSIAQILSAMGMPAAFDPAKADFTGMGKPTIQDGRLCISEVFH